MLSFVVWAVAPHVLSINNVHSSELQTKKSKGKDALWNRLDAERESLCLGNLIVTLSSPLLSVQKLQQEQVCDSAFECPHI